MKKIGFIFALFGFLCLSTVSISADELTRTSDGGVVGENVQQPTTNGTSAFGGYSLGLLAFIICGIAIPGVRLYLRHSKKISLQQQQEEQLQQMQKQNEEFTRQMNEEQQRQFQENQNRFMQQTMEENSRFTQQSREENERFMQEQIEEQNRQMQDEMNRQIQEQATRDAQQAASFAQNATEQTTNQSMFNDMNNFQPPMF